MTIADLVNRIQVQRQNADVILVQRAYQFADEAHRGKYRLTGEPFVTHPLAVATILAELEMDEETIAAALLHDVVEDCEVPLETLREQFGDTVAKLVNGVTKLMQVDFTNPQEKQAENLRKMFLAMSDDIRVIIIKLADRLHNLRTLDPFPPQRRKEIAQETLHIFAPIAHRLGIQRIKWELEDRSLKYLESDVYEDIVLRVNKTRAERMHLVQEAISQLSNRLKEEGIEAEIQGRPKHFYSIYEKMRKQEIDFDKIYDLTAIRIIVRTIPECYGALGVVHSLWLPIEGMDADYIAKPKPNNYRSLHTKVLGPDSEPMEVQIRTWEMHREADYGIAAHWRYKREGDREQRFGDKLRWLQVMLELQHDQRDPNEFLESLKLDLYQDQVFVFTPKGDAIELPVGSTPIDFAYRIHTEVGNRCIGARVNGQIISLDRALENGDICEIISAKTPRGPSRDWLEFVKTPNARNRIKSYLRKQSFEENREDGRNRIERACRAAPWKFRALLDSGLFDKIAKAWNLKDADALFAAVGWGEYSTAAVVSRIETEMRKEKPVPAADSPPKKPSNRNGQGRLDVGVATKGVDNVFFRVSQCCAPLPGDRIIGYITRGRGVTIHRSDCHNIKAYSQREPDRLMEVEWTFNKDVTYQAEIVVEALDRVGLLKDIASIISERKINIESSQSFMNKSGYRQINFVLAIHHLNDLTVVMDTIHHLSDVLDVRRVVG
jgi:GTP pyrophosphokinase